VRRVDPALNQCREMHVSSEERYKVYLRQSSYPKDNYFFNRELRRGRCTENLQELMKRSGNAVIVVEQSAKGKRIGEGAYD